MFLLVGEVQHAGGIQNFCYDFGGLDFNVAETKHGIKAAIHFISGDICPEIEHRGSEHLSTERCFYWPQTQ